jgi:hypothetical protein
MKQIKRASSVRRRLRLVRLLVIFSVGATCLLAEAPSAGAATCLPGVNCHRIGYWNAQDDGGWFLGVGARHHVSNFAANDFNNGFVNQSVTWLRSIQGGMFWVEIGVTHGTPIGNQKKWYWADMRNGGGYHEHFMRNSVLGENVDAAIEWAGGGSYSVWMNGSVVGWSTSHQCCSQRIDIGAEELSTDGFIATSWHDSLWWKDGGGTWNSGWWECNHFGDLPNSWGSWLPCGGEFDYAWN